MFDRLTALTRLTLADNELASLRGDVFADLTSLSILTLNGNALTALPDDVFEPLAALTELKLANNPREPFAPTAEALPDDGTVSDAGGMVTLDGSGSGGAWGTNVTYSWVLTTTTNGVTFDDNTSATPEVTIPALAADTVLTFTLTVTGKGGTSGIDTDTDTATVTVTGTTSTDATLSGLTLQDGEGTVITLSPTFPSETTTDYTAQVANGVDTVTLTATKNDSTATVAIADDDDTNKPGEAVLNLDVGSNTLTVTVTAEDGTTKTYTVTVTRAAANTAPTATDSLVTTDEDTAHHFAASEFNFDDTDAGDTLASVTVVTLPAVGALALNSTAVTAGDTVTKSQLDANQLTFMPAADGNGDAYASFTFRVSDGTDESAADYSMTVNVTAVNDDATGKPTIEGTAQAGETLMAGTSDIMDADGLPSSFTYQWVRLDSDGTSNEMDIGSNSDTYTLMADDEGKKVKVKVTFTDNGGTTETVTSDAYPASGTIAPGTPTNTAPTATDSLVTTDEDTAHHFTASEFNFDDTDAGDTLASVTVVTLPAAGALALDGTPVTAGDTVTKSQLDANQLTFMPAADGNGDAYASFTFRVSDGTDESAEDYGMTVNVTAVNDAATGKPMISGTAQVGEILTASTSGVLDNDGLANVSYSYQWVREDADGSNPADIGTDSDTYTLMADDEGKKVKVKVTFTDNGGTTETVTSDAYPASGTIAPGTPTNTAPTATDSLVTTDEDTAHHFTASEFNFDDTDAGDTLASVTVVTLPAVGALALDSTAVTAGDTVTKIQLDANQLTFMPAADGNGDAYASFTFRVSDGTDESAADYIMTVNVTAVNDDATGKPTIEGTSQAGQELTAHTDGISDPDGKTKAENGDADYAYTYQWIRVDGANEIDIYGETSNAYTLTADDIGKTVKVSTSFTDDADNVEGPLTSDAYPSSGTIATAGICDRTPAVRDALVSLISGVDDCVGVTATHLANITSIDLSRSSIADLMAGDFAGLTALMELNLAGNLLASLPAGVFDGLASLTSLSLDDNGLESLHDDVFADLTSLTSLSLDDNSLASLPAGVFADLTSLTELALAGNSLASLPTGVFDSLTLLTYLNLTDNKLASLSAGVFDGLTSLQSLYLTDNLLASLNAGVFDDLTSLTLLTLNGNALNMLPNDVFADLTRLTTLWLQDNPGTLFKPTADALPDDGTVSDEGGTVTLDGSDSGGAWGTNVTYSWVLTPSTSGVTFDDNTSATPEVVIPALAADTVLTFTLTVTGKGGTNGIDTDTDTATVTVTGTTTTSTDATLSGLTLQDGEGTVITLSPTFPSDMTTDYTAQVANGVDTVTLTATQNDSTATVAIANDDDTSKPGEAELDLIVGTNMLTVTVTAEDGTTKTYTVTVTQAAANTAPTATDSLVTTDEDTAHHFTASEFNFDDTDAGDTLASVTVVTLPAVGALALDSTAVTAGDTVTKIQLDANQLTFMPAADGNGDAYASFTFRVSDGTDESAADYSMTVNVTAVNDDATGKPTIMGTAQVGETLMAGTSDIMDADGLPSSFTFQWVRVNSDGTSNEMDIGSNSDTYTLMADDEGKKVKVKVTFTDNGGTTETVTSDAYPASGTIVAANTAPTATDSLVTTDEDTAHHFAASEFNFNDTDAGDTLASVTVVTLPTVGALALNSTAVTAGDTVTKSQLDANQLTFMPAADGNGDAYASFTFRVSDGTDESAADYSMTVNVTAVNDAATGKPTIMGTAQVGETLMAGTTDIMDADGLPSSFTYQWVRVDSDGTSNEMDIGSNSDTYTLMADDEGKKVKVKVTFTDNGGTTETVTSDAYPASGTIVARHPHQHRPDGDRFVGNDRRGHGAPLCGARFQLQRHRHRRYAGERHGGNAAGGGRADARRHGGDGGGHSDEDPAGRGPVDLHAGGRR